MSVAATQKNREMFSIKKSYSIENGYPARRRSLVDDARFETLVVKQTKQTVLDEARLRANDTSVEPELITSTDVEEVEITENIKSEPTETENDVTLTEEELVLANFIAENPEKEKENQSAAFVLRLKDGINSLSRVLRTIDMYQGNVRHLETRPFTPKSTNETNQQEQQQQQLEALVKVDMSRVALLQLIKALRQSGTLESSTLIGEDSVSNKTPWFPRHASELDNCNHLMTKYEPDLDMDHPGFADKEYRARRKYIAEVAFSYKYGDPVPHIDYNETETKTWASVFKNVEELMCKHACAEYRRTFRLLQDEKIFVKERIPQLEEVSNFLRLQTGFSLRPAAGLLTARDFLASLAFRIFQSTQYIRHMKTPFHTPEPDCIHELLGHIPLLADPSFAQFSQEIGLASLGASDAEIEKLSTVYWFTVEFGLCKEDGAVKAYGAGLLSAYGELLHALSDKPQLKPFEPSVTAVQAYQDQEYQPIYFVAESFDDMKDKFRRWVSSMSRPFEVRYDPHTGRVQVLDTADKLEGLIHQLNTEVLHLANAINKMKNLTMCC